VGRLKKGPEAAIADADFRYLGGAQTRAPLSAKQVRARHSRRRSEPVTSPGRGGEGS
jgi:hypothetical protein